MKTRKNTPFLVAVLALFLCSTTYSAEDMNKNNPNLDQKMIDALVVQLDHARITKRQEAQANLLKAGKLAIPSLAKAALSGKRDMIEKSIDILAKLTQSNDKETQDAARVTLKMLSESKQPSTAERAKIALNTKQAGGIKPFEGWDKPNGEFARGMNRSTNRSVSISSVNGIRTINVNENGLNTNIIEQPGGSLVVSVTGGDKPIQLIAKNVDDLKKQNPKAFELYKQHSEENKRLKGFTPFGNGIANVSQKAVANATNQQAAVAGGMNASNLLIQQLKELKVRMANSPEMQAMLDQQIKMITGK